MNVSWDGSMLSIASSLTAALLATSCATGDQQSDGAIPYQTESASCPECRIELEKIVTLGTADGPGGLPEEIGPIRRDSQGRYYVIPRRTGLMPIVFSPRGEFVAHIGRQGEGPGELIYPRRLFLMADDTVHVQDFNRGTVSVFSPTTWEYVRRYRLSWSHAEAIAWGDSVILINGELRTADRIGYALHRLDSEGEIALSFEEYAPRPREPTWMRAIGVGPSGVWSAPYAHGHVLRLFDPSDGSLIREIERESSWYPSSEEFVLPTPDDPPGSVLRGIWEADGVVWTIGWSHRRDWAGHLGNPVDTPEGRLYPYRYDEVYNGIVEAVDPSTGRLIASVRIDTPPLSVVGPGLIVLAREDSVGWWYADIYRLTLSRP